ncbi:MAG TPA: Na+/H+ antiporter subunit B [Kiritimatiellia bacterium]|nr:Na+/H+ antiporter subunit B [Kiritimatiellia bacterium]
MISLILQTATRFVVPLLLLFSIYLLIVGHNYPGGGFVGGLSASSAFALYAIAFDVPAARRLLRLSPITVSALGLLAATLAGLLAVFAGKPFLTGLWTELPIPGLGPTKIGTPILFDLGVYLVVLGVAMAILFSLAEEED